MSVPCGNCSVCCRAPDGTEWVLELGQADVIAMRGHGLEVDERDWGYFMPSRDNRCVNVGLLGCTIYAQRPQVCRDYDCRQVRDPPAYIRLAATFARARAGAGDGRD